MIAPSHVDLRALREELGLGLRADPRSHEFIRFINRLCETLDVDIPRDEWGQLVAMDDCVAWLHAHHAGRLAAPAQ